MDLISLESPFHNDVVDFDEFQSGRPPQSLAEVDDYEQLWAEPGPTSRGWCEDPPNITAQHLEMPGLEVKHLASTGAEGMLICHSLSRS